MPSLNHNVLNVMLCLCCLIGFGCQQETKEEEAHTLDQMLIELLIDKSQTGEVNYFKLPDSDALGNIPQDPKNPIRQSKVALGKMLFYETGLSQLSNQGFSTGTFSCSSCHFPSGGFKNNLVQGIGDGGVGFGVNGEGRRPHPLYEESEIDVQPIAAPSIVNCAFQRNVFWNGQLGATALNSGLEDRWEGDELSIFNFLGFEGVETQAIVGLTGHRFKSQIPLIENGPYKSLFDEVYPTIPTVERYNTTYTGMAIAAFERTILANEAPFQKWLRGERSAMTIQEKRGAILFFDKAECVNCHTGPALNKEGFEAVGFKDLSENPAAFNVDPNDKTHLGRGGFTGLEADYYKFKVSQLYNLADVSFLGHGSSFTSLRDVIEYKNLGISENHKVPQTQLSEHFHPLNLTETEIDDLEAFLKRGLYDNNLERYQPDFILSNNCFPNNDPISQTDLGCKE